MLTLVVRRPSGAAAGLQRPYALSCAHAAHSAHTRRLRRGEGAAARVGARSHRARSGVVGLGPRAGLEFMQHKIDPFHPYA